MGRVSQNTRPALRLLRPTGLVSYQEALAQQRDLVAQRVAGTAPDTLVLQQHAPVITLGRNADPAGVLAPVAQLRAAGVEVERVERGGQATYHGPGQWVGYPILHLRELGLGVRRYVGLLEEVMSKTFGHFGVGTSRRTGQPGLFTNWGKVAALGVAVRSGVSFHGFALNVCPDLTAYRWIVPCGLVDTPVTSLEEILGDATPELERVAEVLIEEFLTTFGFQLEP